MEKASPELVLTGYAYSVYTRSVQMALAEKAVDYAYVECDPFDPADALRLMRDHPFGRVPVIKHEGFHLYETSAILGYVDETIDGPRLVPSGVRAVARMRQVMSITDSYVYVPLVRQAFSHGVFRPLMGEDADPDALDTGLKAAPRVLDALEEIAAEGLVLKPGQMCLAACYLWPMLDYFALVARGREMLMQRDALSAWMYWMGQQETVIANKPRLPGIEA